jgi:hypothetical protein
MWLQVLAAWDPSLQARIQNSVEDMKFWNMMSRRRTGESTVTYCPLVVLLHFSKATTKYQATMWVTQAIRTCM